MARHPPSAVSSQPLASSSKHNRGSKKTTAGVTVLVDVKPTQKQWTHSELRILTKEYVKLSRVRTLTNDQIRARLKEHLELKTGKEFHEDDIRAGLGYQHGKGVIKSVPMKLWKDVKSKKKV